MVVEALSDTQHRHFARTNAVPIIAAIIVAVILSVPIELETPFGLPNASYLLAPAIALAFFTSVGDRLNVAFFIAAICGQLTIIIAHYLSPAGLISNTAVLAIGILLPASFIFLGRALYAMAGGHRVIFWLAVFSSIFLIAISVPLIISGQSVRALNPDGTAFLNVNFLGLPVYATYGVNSLAPLFAIQAALICGAAYVNSRSYLLLFVPAVVASSFLVVGSESRASQICIAILICTIALFAVLGRKELKISMLLLISTLIPPTYSVFNGGDKLRFVSTVSQTADILTPRDQSTSDHSVETNQSMRTYENVDDLSTGRIGLWRTVIKEVAESPIIGNGFSTFGRYSPDSIPKGLEANTSAHLYYLDLLWKGGLLFFVPFSAFGAIAVCRAYQQRSVAPDRVFAATGVFMMASAPSLTWDILSIPSAGALAWLLLGGLTTSAGIAEMQSDKGGSFARDA